MNSRVVYSVIFFVLCMVLIGIKKPSFAFDYMGYPKHFGIRKEDSLLSYGSISVGLSVVSHIIFGIIDLIAIP